jgi:HEAT repeat protein
MRSKRFTIIIFFLLALVLIASSMFTVQKEPTWQGKGLDDWLSLLLRGSREEQRRAVQAVQQIGSNAVPYLLKCIDYKPGVVRETLFRIFKGRLPQSLAPRDAMFMRNKAATAFCSLGERASCAAPDLERIMNDSHSLESSRLCMVALLGIGKAGIAPLERALADPRRSDREVITVSIRMSKPSGVDLAPFVPVLIRCMEETNSSFAATAARTLGSIHRNSNIAVPALINGLQHSNPRVRAESAMALGRFRREALNAVPALNRARGDSDYEVNHTATVALHYIETDEDPEKVMSE